MDRRTFLTRAGVAVLGFGASPLFLTRALSCLAAESSGLANGKTLVVVIQRGAMDGLSLVAPIGDPFYLASRPNIALKFQGDNSAIKLDSHFGLHPSFASLHDRWEAGNLAFVHQCGSPDNSRSHFDAQDFLETGSPGSRAPLQDGFLNRALARNLGALGLKPATLAAIAFQPSMPRILRGKFSAISMNSLADYAIQPRSQNLPDGKGFETMYQGAADQVFRGVGQEVFESIQAVALLRQRDKELRVKLDELYPKTQFSKRLAEIASLVHAKAGLRLAVTDTGGWDTHNGQGGGRGQLADRLRELSDGLAAFAQDLGPKLGEVCVVCVTEFGRTVRENGTRGTDHGHGSVMTLLGGAVKGKTIHGAWKELKAENLYEGRDLPVTTDSRDVFAEVLQSHLGLTDLEGVFPGYPLNPVRKLGVLV